MNLNFYCLFRFHQKRTRKTNYNTGTTTTKTTTRNPYSGTKTTRTTSW